MCGGLSAPDPFPTTTFPALPILKEDLQCNCSHEIKRLLLLGRKVMTNLDSILKSRDITLPTKVRLIKALVFPVVVMDVRVGL